MINVLKLNVMNEQIYNYVKENLSKGFTKEQIRKALTDQNIPVQDIDEAFNSLKQNQPTQQPVQESSQQPAQEPT
ncbi:hypothetical protein D6777_03650, partial [Candidatus Woesearchaeota archaeon]